MDKTKSYSLIIFIYLITICVIPVWGQTTLREWKSFTSLRFTQDMVNYNNEIWTATTGGLVRINSDDMSYRVYTNVDGLRTNQLNCLYVDAANRLWIGGRGRLIDFSNPENAISYLFTDRDGDLIDIVDIDGVLGADSLWLASREGLTLFLPGNSPGDGLILDTYNRFGDIDRNTPANCVAVSSDRIWVGTDGGYAFGSRSDVRQLKAPTGWTSFLPSDISSLSGDTVRTLANLRDTIYIGTNSGPYRFDESSPALINLNLYGDPLIYNMSTIGDSLLINNSYGSVLYHDGKFIGLPTVGMPIPNSTGGAFDNNGVFWNGNLVEGIFYAQSNEMIYFETGSMPSNDCRQIVNAQGRIWGAFWSAGLAYYENETWTKVDLEGSYVYSLGVGPLGELWVGTWGRGVFRIMGDSVANFKTDNSALSGIAEAPTFVVVADIHSSGNAIWFANLRGRNGELVAVNPYDLTQWQNYILTGGAQAEWVETLYSGQDVIYVGSNNNGIFARLYNGTPFQSSDDYIWQFTSANSGIGSDIIQVIAIDEYDSMWVGTAFGLSQQGLGEIIFNNIDIPEGFGSAVTAIAFDGQGSLYAGSNQGMAIRDLATGAFEHLTVKNSGLIDNRINDIYYQADNMTFWIATSAGISQLRMPGLLASDKVEEVLAYPNPYIIRYGNETIRFNFAGLSDVRIFTAAGELIKEIPITGIWDGLNNHGEPAASGLYLFTITARDGSVGRGKIFLVRE